MSLGTYPEVSLRGARALRDEVRALLAKDINPKIDRKKKFRAAFLAAEHSFKAVYLQWIAHRKLELKEGRQSALSQIPGRPVSLEPHSLAPSQPFGLDRGLWV